MLFRVARQFAFSAQPFSQMMNLQVQLLDALEHRIRSVAIESLNIQPLTESAEMQIQWRRNGLFVAQIALKRYNPGAMLDAGKQQRKSSRPIGDTCCHSSSGRQALAQTGKSFAGIGRAIPYPWASSQPSCSNILPCAKVSTPSAMTSDGTLTPG